MDAVPCLERPREPDLRRDMPGEPNADAPRGPDQGVEHLAA